MLDRVFIGCVWRHGDEVNSFHDATSSELFSDLFAFVEGCIVPDNGNGFVGVLFKKLFHSYEHCSAVLFVCHLVEMAFVTLLVQKTNVALVLLFAVNLNDCSLTFLEPTSPYNGFLLHLDFTNSKDLPVVTVQQGLYLGSDAPHPLKDKILVTPKTKDVWIFEG